MNQIDIVTGRVVVGSLEQNDPPWKGQASSEYHYYSSEPVSGCQTCLLTILAAIPPAVACCQPPCASLCQVAPTLSVHGSPFVGTTFQSLILSAHQYYMHLFISFISTY